MIFSTLFGFLLGICLGSFIKVVADRSLEENSIQGRSICPNCRKKLAWFDLFPIISYLILRGKCRYCKKPISKEYPLFEILFGLIIALLFYLNLPDNFLRLDIPSLILIGLNLSFQIFIISVVMAILITDLKKGLIPDRITYPAIVIGFTYLVLSTLFKSFLLYHSLASNEVGRFLLPPHSNYFIEHVIIAASPLWMGFLTALGFGVFFAGLIFFTGGKGMGGGDFKLGIFLGLVLGFPNALVALMLSFLGGSIVGIALLFLGKKKFGQTIPFGPFLSFGAIATIFWGERILNWYLHFQF